MISFSDQVTIFALGVVLLLFLIYRAAARNGRGDLQDEKDDRKDFRS